jgi:phosphatidylinositol-3,4,5-trisphosphate 3-phosphatase/dual-specificity protein phosphatase PTEN
MEENTDASVKSNEGQEENPNSESLSPKPTTGSVQELPGKFSAAGVANWAKNLRISSNPNVNTPEKNSISSEGLKNPFSLLGGSFGRKTDSLKIPVVEVPIDSESSSSNEGTFGNLAKGILDTSKSAMRAVQTKARHLVSQNKRRYQVILDCLTCSRIYTGPKLCIVSSCFSYF